MKLALCLFNYFPHGGLQRDFFRIAEQAHRAGHEIDVYCMQWKGDKPVWLNIHIITTSGITNHGRCKQFIRKLHNALSKQHYNKIIGFNKIPGVDIYYAADGCLASRPKYQKWYAKFLPRYRFYLSCEKKIFEPNAKTQILSISPTQEKEYIHYYQTPLSRIHRLPPGIDRERLTLKNPKKSRVEYRNQLGIDDNQFLFISIGSHYRTKGIDRSLNAFAALPDVLRKQSHFVVIGYDHHMQRYQQKTVQLSLTTYVTFLGTRNDIAEWLNASDVLLHPARVENTGTVLLEALVLGIPVITSNVCGYAEYIQDAQAGIILPEPFEINALTAELSNCISNNALLNQMSQNGKQYADKENLYGLVETALNHICQ